MIELKNVSYAYRITDEGGNQVLRPAVKHISLTIRAGEFLVLTGGSGCGKTTVCRLINGLIPHYFEGDLQGHILVAGKDVTSQPIYETSRTVGSVFQNPRSQFFNVDTTSELAFAAENQGRDPSEIRQDIATAAKQLGLTALLDRSMFALSGGEKQKIACGSVAVADTDIVVLDEPSSNLDVDGIEELRKTLALWKMQGKTIIIAEHRLYFLRELADRVLLFREGQIIHEFSSEAFCALHEADAASLGMRAIRMSALSPCSGSRIFSNRFFQIEQMDYTYQNKRYGIHIPELQIPQNEILAVIGHNGAGKSTFARTLCGLNKKAKGKVHLNGEKIPVSKMLPNCYMVMQDVNHQLFTNSVLEEVTLSIPPDCPHEKKHEKAMSTLRLLNLEPYADIHPMALSGGQKQRVAIAGGIASEKEIIILDEPSSGLDYRHMRQVSEVLKMLKKHGRTVLLITHDWELIYLCADHILHLENGTVKEIYPMNDENTYKLRAFFSRE